jgi:hypothetical protein
MASEDQETSAAFKRERYTMLAIAARTLFASCVTWIVAVFAIN